MPVPGGGRRPKSAGRPDPVSGPQARCETGGVVDVDLDLVADAEACARAAADAHGLTIAELHGLDEHRAAADLLCRVWGAASPDQVANASLLRALAHSGNYVVGAFRAGGLVGVAVAFLGTGHLHSHITGVDRSGQGAGVGYALKQHQRAWALARAIPAVHWTYDPLVRRNAYFNLHKLGAAAREYLPDFYGPMDDGINSGDTTDRLYVTWDLAHPRAVAAAHGDAPEADTGGAVAMLDRVDDEPAPTTATPARTRVVAMPADVEKLRTTDLAAALRWRYAVRAALTEAFADGYAISDATRDGYYVLDRNGAA
jgi:predicted GNAT superfamily acetyltransferase